MADTPACLRCDKQLNDSFQRDLWPIPAPSEGTLFTSRGNYGSTLWDPGPSPDRRYLLAVICDECLSALRETGQIFIVTPPPEVQTPPEVQVWQAGEE